MTFSISNFLTALNNQQDSSPDDGGVAVIDRPPVLTPTVANVEQPQLPPMYAVILLNDDSSNREFVVDVLSEVFRLNSQRAMAIMMAAHTTGKAVVVICSREVAESKVEQARSKIARDGQGQNGRSPDAACALKFTAELETKGE